jgi:hypothetical protein
VNFVISAGAVAPDSITYNRPKDMPAPGAAGADADGRKEKAGETTG